MLEFSKTIIEKVSFDKILFEKEFNKLRKWLKGKELKEFEKWCFSKFRNIYPDVLSKFIRRKK